MKVLLLAAGLFASTGAIAQAQQSAAPPTQTSAAAPAPAATAAPSAAVLNGDTPIETLMARPDTKAILLKYVPEIENHPAYDQFKGMSLRQLEPMAGGIITDDKIAAMEADLKKLK